MAGWLPWTNEVPTFIRLEVASYSLQMERLQLGDSKAITRREKRFNDLVLHQRNRPRTSDLEIRFGAFLKTGATPQSWQYPLFVKIMREHPGWPVTLIYPDETVQHGFIVDHSYDEVSDCQTEIFFKFEIAREYPQGKVIVA